MSENDRVILSFSVDILHCAKKDITALIEILRIVESRPEPEVKNGQVGVAKFQKSELLKWLKEHNEKQYVLHLNGIDWETLEKMLGEN